MSTDLKTEAMEQAFEKRFNTKIEINWNILSSCYVTVRADKREMTEEQVGWMEGWTDERMAT
jgi:hypothetical protein